MTLDTLKRKTIMSSDDSPTEMVPEVRRTTPKGSFWSRYSTIINFWLDVLLLILFMIQALMFAVLHVVFPRGAGSDWKIWGATPLDWSEALFVTFCIFSVAIVLHVMFASRGRSGRRPRSHSARQSANRKMVRVFPDGVNRKTD